MCLPAFSFAASAGATQVLEQMLQAERTQGFSARFIYSNGSSLASGQIDRTFSGSTTAERVFTSRGEILDHRADGDLHYSIDLARKTIMVQPLDDAISSPSVPPDWESLSDYYQFQLGDIQRVAGLDCQVVSMLPKDEFRYGGSYCVEGTTGLALRSSSVSNDGRVLEQLMFTRVRLQDPGEMAPSLEELQVLGFQSESSEIRKLQSDAPMRWSLLGLPQGFKLQIEQIRQDGIDTEPYLFLSFSDGLATVSLFLKREKGPLTRFEKQAGALSTLQRPLGEYRLTLVGEVPPATLNEIASHFVLDHTAEQ